MSSQFNLGKGLSSSQIIMGLFICISAYFWWQADGNSRLDQYLANRGLEKTAHKVVSKIPSIKGIMINSKTKKPLKVVKVRLQHDLDGDFSYSEVNGDGSFEIWMDKLPPGKKINLIIQYANGEFKALQTIDLKNEKRVDYQKEMNTYSVGLLEVYPPIENKKVVLEEESEFQLAKVKIKSGYLRMREEKRIESRPIGKIPRNEMVNVLYHSDEFENIRGKWGEWVVVNYKDTEGFVFDGYLTYLD